MHDEVNHLFDMQCYIPFSMGILLSTVLSVNDHLPANGSNQGQGGLVFFCHIPVLTGGS
jgi:hypothetical protein